MGERGTPIEIADRPSDEDMSKCVHCGFCLQECPTYLQLGLETDSPRGRIHMIKALTDGRIDATSSLVGHLDLCLQCRACETACPSGVPFGRIMETGRAMLVQEGRIPWLWKLRIRALRMLFPYPKRMRFMFSAIRVYQRYGIQWVLRTTRILNLIPGLAEADAMLLVIPRKAFSMPEQTATASQQTKRAALLTGCVMPHLYPRTHEATIRVLARNDVEVIDVAEQLCCGALNLHAGDRRTARELARRNIDAFLAADIDVLVVNSAGCGSAMQEYGELLEQDPAYADKARRFSTMVRDINDFLAELPFQRPAGEVRERVTYQDSCHLVHAQKVRSAPREILRAIPGLELAEMQAADRCCGSAGVYSFGQREMSMRLLDEKMHDVEATGAAVIATANPGCMLQLEAGVRRGSGIGRVVHVVELLDEAYQAEGERT